MWRRLDERPVWEKGGMRKGWDGGRRDGKRDGEKGWEKGGMGKVWG